MANTRKSRSDPPLTTAQRLGSLVKSARDIMRKDKGLNGDLDRLPMLTWILFLKFLDDHEVIREDRAKMKKEKYRAVIEAPYRWRDWAAKEDGISGDSCETLSTRKKPCGRTAAKAWAWSPTCAAWREATATTGGTWSGP
jgi:hypothetical protein